MLIMMCLTLPALDVRLFGQVKQSARGAMGGSGQSESMNNPSGQGQGNLGQGFGTNQGNLGQGFDNTGALFR